MTSIALAKITASIILYFVFLFQVVLQMSSKFILIKSLFANVLKPGKYDLRKDTFVTIGGGFLIQLTSLLLAVDRLSTCILTDLKKNQVARYISDLIASINNFTYLFKISIVLSIIIVLIRRTIAHRRNGDLIKVLRNLGWLLLFFSLVILHLLDPSSDYLIGHWKN